jgi:hypothetical protein
MSAEALVSSTKTSPAKKLPLSYIGHKTVRVLEVLLFNTPLVLNVGSPVPNSFLQFAPGYTNLSSISACAGELAINKVLTARPEAIIVLMFKVILCG